MHGRGHVWQGGMHRGACMAWGHAWQGDMCGRGVCVAGAMARVCVADTMRYGQ